MKIYDDYNNDQYEMSALVEAVENPKKVEGPLQHAGYAHGPLLNDMEAKEFQFKDGIALGYQCLLDKKVKFHENNNIDYMIPTVAKLQVVEGKEGTHFSTTEEVLSSMLDAFIV